MQRVLNVIIRISRTYPKLSSMFVAATMLWIDVVTDKEIRFPLVYVIPVGMAAWRKERALSYGLAVVLPLLSIGYEFPWGGSASLTRAGLNALIEMVSMILYAYLIGRSAAQTGHLRKTITIQDQEIGQLRSFTRLTGTTMQGRGLAPGMAEGVVWIYQPHDSDWASTLPPIRPNEAESEIERLDRALAAAIRELTGTQQRFADTMGDMESDLLDVQLTMLGDDGFWSACKKRVRGELIKPEQAVAEEIRKMAAKLEGMKQDVMRDRGADVRDIGRRVLRHIGVSTEAARDRLASLPPHTVLVAKELLPSDMFQIDHANLAALVTENNSPASHVAILARNRNIPAVSDIKDAATLLSSGDRLLVDADSGSVTVAPTRVQEERFTARKIRAETRDPVGTPDDIEDATTRDGVRIGLYANISRPDEARLALEYGLQGVGLFRSEFLFLDVAQPPSLDAQAAAYAAVAKTLRPCPVTIRTMDFGGDKIPRFNRAESNLAFRAGKRGLAFSLAEKSLFRTQVQAILRSSQTGDVRIMFPMVMGVADLAEARRIVDELFENEHLDKPVIVGAMIETPASVFHFDEIVKRVDFVSIGTNDLAHFILATDRQSQESSGTLAFLHPSVLRATEHVVRTALKQGIGVSVCGEAASNPASVCLLVGMGVRNLSMNPFHASGVRRFLRQTTLEKMETTTREALGAATQTEVQEITAAVLRE